MIDEGLIARLRLYGRSEVAVLEAADRIEVLIAERDQWIAHAKNAIWADSEELKEAEAYAEELEADRKKTYEALLKVSRIHGEVEAKLAKAECLLTDAAVQLENGKIKTRRNRADLIWQFLEEIKGESHDHLHH